MNGFSLPPMRTGEAPPFLDRSGCEDWLGRQPLTNALAAMRSLAACLDGLNSWPIAPRERYRIAETLRRPAVEASAAVSRLYAHRPLPRTPAEASALAGTCRLWQTLAEAYLRCVNACLEGDSGLVDHAAKICHRAISALRHEQLCRLRARSDVPARWWEHLHELRRAAVRLGVARVMVADRLLAETRESTVDGHYAMAVLLSRCRTETLTRDEFAAAVRWLARWRELSGGAADSGREARPDGAALDEGTAVKAVLGKLRRRIAALRAGESPESLKLGSALSSADCIDLMQRLLAALSRPALASTVGGGEGTSSLELVASLEAIHRWLGGSALSTPAAPTTTGTLREREQIAVFGRVVNREAAGTTPTLPDIAGESWQARPDDMPGGLTAWRPPDGTQRLNGRSLVAVRMDGRIRLATIAGLMQEEGGPVRLWLALQAGTPRPAMIDVAMVGGNSPARHPALFVPADTAAGAAAMLFVPPLPPGATVAVAVPADLPPPAGRVVRGEDFECWSCL